MHRLALFRALGFRAAASTMIAMGLVLGVGLVAGGIRLLPWLVSDAVPLRVALPFAKSLAAAAFEVAVLVGLPLGWALAAAISVERGEARALFAIGIDPKRIVASTFPLTLGIAALSGLFVGIFGRELAAPGRFVSALFEEGRLACEDGRAFPRAVEVPLVSATWLCFDGSPPRLVGSLSKERAAPFSASSIRIEEDLGAVALEDLHLHLVRAAPIRLHVDRAYVRGLTIGERAPKFGGGKRAALLAGTAACLALLVGWLILRSGMSARVLALAIGLAGPLAAWGLLSWLERAEAEALAYLVVPVAAAVATFVTYSLRGCVPERRTR